MSRAKKQPERRKHSQAAEAPTLDAKAFPFPSLHPKPPQMYLSDMKIILPTPKSLRRAA